MIGRPVVEPRTPRLGGFETDFAITLLSCKALQNMQHVATIIVAQELGMSRIAPLQPPYASTFRRNSMRSCAGRRR